jgi:hypothetical protein
VLRVIIQLNVMGEATRFPHWNGRAGTTVEKRTVVTSLAPIFRYMRFPPLQLSFFSKN